MVDEQQNQKIVIFVSSSDDLQYERDALGQMIKGLNNDPVLKEKYEFKVLFRKEVKDEKIQGSTWQEYVNLFGQNIAMAHIVIGILWGHVGIEPANIINPITNMRCRSCLEYEISTACYAYRRQGLPQVLLYQIDKTIPKEDADGQAQQLIVKQFTQEMQAKQVIPDPVPTFSDAQDLSQQVEKALAVLLPEIEKTLRLREQNIAPLPALPIDFMPRTEKMLALVNSVRAHPVTLLHGLSGQGKSVMARAVYDQVSADFQDGIVWATFGQKSSLARVRREMILQLHGNLANAYDAASAHEEFIRCLRSSQVLLVFDNVWRASDVETMLDSIPPNCHVLITSRNASLLEGIAKIELEPMAPLECKNFLNKISGGRVQDDAIAHSIIDRFNALTLALRIVGTRLNHYSWQQIQELLANSPLKAAPHPMLPLLDINVRLLPPDLQERYRELVIFPEDEPLVEAAVARLWAQTANLTPDAARYLLDLFQSLSLIQPNGRLHDFQQTYLAATTPKQRRKQLHEAFIETYGPAKTWDTLPDDGYSWRWFAWHLAQANHMEELRHLLLDATYLQNKITRLQSSAVIMDLNLFSGDMDISLLSQTINLSRHILDRKPQELPNQIAGRAETLYQQLHNWRSWSKPHFRLDSNTLKHASNDVLHIMRHIGPINSCAFSPDGLWILTASDDKTLRMWDAQEGKQLQLFIGHTEPVSICAFSPDGLWALSASYDNTLRLWNTQTGEAGLVLTGHTEKIIACAFSPDGQWVVSASTDGTLRRWDMQDQGSCQIFTGHAGPITACTLSADGQWVLSASDDKTLRLWSLHSGKSYQIFTGHLDKVTACAFSPNGRLALSASTDRTLRLWDVQNGKCIHTFSGHTDRITSCMFGPDGHWAVSSSWDSTLRLWDIQTREFRHVFTGHSDRITACALSPDGQWILSASADSTLRLWNVRIGKVLQRFAGHTGPVAACAFSPDGQSALSVSADQTVRLWEIHTEEDKSASTKHTRSVSDCAFSPDRRWVLSASADSTLRLWDVQTKKSGRLLSGHTDRVTACAFSSDGKWALSASADQTLRLWDMKNGSTSHIFTGHTNWIRACAFSDDGQWILSASDDNTLRLWDMQSKETHHIFTGHTGPVTDCAFSSDGQWILSASDDQTLRLWQVQTGKTQYIYRGHTDAVSSCAFSPNGQSILSASADHTLRLWDIQTGKVLQTFEGHANAVWSCLISPDGQWVLSASADRTLRVWDAATGEEVAQWLADNSIMHIDLAGQQVIACEGNAVHFLSLVHVSIGMPVERSQSIETHSAASQLVNNSREMISKAKSRLQFWRKTG